MDIDNLVHMANRIGEFFQSMPDHDEAAHEIAQHLSKFWEPRMRQAIIAHVQEGGEGLSELSKDAIKQLTAP